VRRGEEREGRDVLDRSIAVTFLTALLLCGSCGAAQRIVDRRASTAGPLPCAPSSCVVVRRKSSHSKGPERRMEMWRMKDESIRFVPLDRLPSNRRSGIAVGEAGPLLRSHGLNQVNRSGRRCVTRAVVSASDFAVTKTINHAPSTARDSSPSLNRLRTTGSSGVSARLSHKERKASAGTEPLLRLLMAHDAVCRRGSGC
jgi:hypothetical protein